MLKPQGASSNPVPELTDDWIGVEGMLYKMLAAKTELLTGCDIMVGHAAPDDCSAVGAGDGADAAGAGAGTGAVDDEKGMMFTTSGVDEIVDHSDAWCVGSGCQLTFNATEEEATPAAGATVGLHVSRPSFSSFPVFDCHFIVFSMSVPE